MGRIRVIHICNALGTGGMESLLREFAAHTNRETYDVAFVALTSGGAAEESIRALGCNVTLLDQRPGVRAMLPVRLARTLQKMRADVVHTHNTKALIYGAAAARLAGTRGLIHTRHGQRFGATARQTVLFNIAAAQADRVVSVCEASMRIAIADGVAAERAVTIHNGVDVPRFADCKSSPRGPVTFVGRLSAEKDVETLLRASAIVAAAEPAFRLRVLGGGPIEGHLRQLSQALGLVQRVEFTGMRDTPREVLDGAAMFVLPSITEGLSLALLEAMAAALPVIATRVGGNVEAVADGTTGLLVPPGSPQLLAIAILQLYRSAALAGRMGHAGRLRARRHFDVRRMVSQYETLYATALALRSARAVA